MNEYQSLLKDEFNNRIFSYLINEHVARKLAGTPRGDFYQAYFDLEKLNRKIYTRMQEKLNFDHRMGWFTRFKAYAVGTILCLLKEDSSNLESIIVPYMPKLEKLRQLAPPEHSALFDYVVNQEMAQLEAGKATKEGGWEAGVMVFHDFITQQSETINQI